MPRRRTSLRRADRRADRRTGYRTGRPGTALLRAAAGPLLVALVATACGGEPADDATAPPATAAADDAVPPTGEDEDVDPTGGSAFVDPDGVPWSGVDGGDAPTPANADASPHVSHRAEFEAIAARLAASENPYVGRGQLARQRTELARIVEPSTQRLTLLMEHAFDLLRCGETDEALARIADAQAVATALGMPDAARLPIHQLEGLAHLRAAEVANCIRRHNAECCVFPLAGGGRHEEEAPARAARAAFERCLDLAPNQLDSRWLLNLSAMAVGEWPRTVPQPLRIPPTAFASEQDVPRWRDVAGAVGVDAFNHCGGAVVEDFDGDGHLDIVTTTFDMGGPAIFYRGGPGLAFADDSEASRLDDQLGGLNCVAADYDGDGDHDVLVLRGAWLFDDGRIRNSLLQNDGRAVFSDVTESAGLAEPARPTQAAAFGDFDGDGHLDLYIGNESRKEQRGDGDYPGQLFRNDGDGTFTDVAASAGVTNDRYAKGVCVGDHDNDGDLDLYVSNAGPNRLYRNDGDGGFTDVAPELGVTGPEGRSFACWFFDVQNDGWLDLFVGAFDATLADVAADALGLPFEATPPRLYRNEGDGTFTDVAEPYGLHHAWLPMGAGFGDMDGDGWLDVYLATGDPGYQTLVPNVMLRNDRGTRYRDVTTAGGFGHLQKGHGVAFADLDNDGDQDLYNQLGGFYPGDAYANALFRNPGNDHHWLHVRLVGTKSNRAAYGARLKLTLEEDGVRREIHRAVGSVSSFGGAPSRQEIGLGTADRVVSLQVFWPHSGLRQIHEGVEMDRMIEVVEGDPVIRTVPLR